MTKLCPDQIYTIPQQPAALTAPAPANDGALILDIVNTSDNCNDYNGLAILKNTMQTQITMSLCPICKRVILLSMKT